MCRFCGFGHFDPCPDSPSPSLPCVESAQAVCSTNPEELCFLDATCSELDKFPPGWGDGCNAGGVGQNCRFCGFGGFQACKFRGDARNTIGWSRYVLQSGPYTLARLAGLPPSDLGHVGAFFLPFDIRETWGRLRFKGKECKKVDTIFEPMHTIAECALAVGKRKECGPAFMWSNRNSPDTHGWACRCCSKGKDYGGKSNPNWDIYQSYLNWIAFDGELQDEGGYYFPPESVMKTPPHGDGQCGADIGKETDRWRGYGFETTYSDGSSGEYNQTYAYGQAGRYIYTSGSNAMWEGKADKMAFVVTDLPFDHFMRTVQAQAYRQNNMGGYDAARNNCQDFAVAMMKYLNVPKGMTDALHEWMMEPSQWQSELAVAWCSIVGKIFGFDQCWPSDSGGVPMPKNCKTPVPLDPPTWSPKYFGDVILAYT